MICHHRVQNRERTQIVPIELPCIDLHCHNEKLLQWHIATLPNRLPCHQGSQSKLERINLPCKYQTDQPHITKYTNSKYPTALNTCGGGQSGRESFLLAWLASPQWLRTSQNWFSNEISHSIRASFQAFLNLSAKLPRRLNWDWDWADERSLSFFNDGCGSQKFLNCETSYCLFDI